MVALTAPSRASAVAARRTASPAWWLLALILGVSACTGSSSDVESALVAAKKRQQDASLNLDASVGADGAAVDAGISDGGSSDTGISDTGIPDTGIPDTGIADTGSADAALSDAGGSDSGATSAADASAADASVADASVDGSPQDVDVDPKDVAQDPCKNKMCDDGNLCTDETCDGGTGGCVPTANAATCTDDDACTVGDVCANMACAPGKQTSCDDNNPCTDDTCAPKTGKCANLPNAASCTDADQCTEKEICAAGKCGVAVDCNDSNVCTVDACDPKSGCTHAPVASGTSAPCSDGDACTTADVCDNGVCKAGVTTDCNKPTQHKVEFDQNANTLTGTTAWWEDGVSVQLTGGPDKDTPLNIGKAADGLNNVVKLGSKGVQLTVKMINGSPFTLVSLSGAIGTDSLVIAGKTKAGQTVSGAFVHSAAGSVMTMPAGFANLVSVTITTGYGDLGMSIHSLDDIIVIGAPNAPACQLSATCNAKSGACEHASYPDGTACFDGDLCTKVDTCKQGKCIGSAAIQCGKDETHTLGFETNSAPDGSVEWHEKGMSVSMTGGPWKGSKLTAANLYTGDPDNEVSLPNKGGQFTVKMLDGRPFRLVSVWGSLGSGVLTISGQTKGGQVVFGQFTHATTGSAMLMLPTFVDLVFVTITASYSGGGVNNHTIDDIVVTAAPPIPVCTLAATCSSNTGKCENKPIANCK